VPRKIIGAGLSKKSVGRKDRRLLYIPLMLALIMLAVVYLLVVAPSASPHAAVDFTLKMSVQYNNPVNQTEARFIAPRTPVGVSGGLWASHQFDSYGLDGHYPLFTELSPNHNYFLLHVRSVVAHNYTLGDFFAVWGYPLGENNTIGVVASNGSLWQLCVGLAPPHLRPIISNWGQEVLVKDVYFFLIYYNPSLGAGCA
jgi:hypothetical protein